MTCKLRADYPGAIDHLMNRGDRRGEIFCGGEHHHLPKGSAVGRQRLEETLAVRLRRETTMTVQWIVNRLQMGAKTHLAHLLSWQRRNEK